MIVTDEDALICDLAETYHIYDYKSLSPLRVAAFSVGLRENSRIKLKMNNAKYPIETLLQAMIVDRLSILVWMRTKDGRDGTNKPQSILSKLLGEAEEKDVVSFETPEEFENEWQRITKGGAR